MTTMKVSAERPIDLLTLKDELEAIKKRDEELGFRSNKTYEYVNQFVTKDMKKGLVEALQKIDIPRLKDVHIVKIADFMPTSVDTLKIILQGYPITVNADNLKKIVKTVTDFKAK